jgi:hypothetical protein
MTSLQVRLEALLASFPRVEAFMEMPNMWMWPIVESIHFIGLTLLLGSIAAWDLRLLGLMKRCRSPHFIASFRSPCSGFGINVMSGSLFLVTNPDQYVYNSAFHLKLLSVALAGVNVVVFYLTTFRRVKALGPGAQAPLLARINGAVSLAPWVTVIICGRMITFYRPGLSPDGGPLDILADCIVR